VLRTSAGAGAATRRLRPHCQSWTRSSFFMIMKESGIMGVIVEAETQKGA
jgi:hypothetical protein